MKRDKYETINEQLLNQQKRRLMVKRRRRLILPVSLLIIALVGGGKLISATSNIKDAAIAALKSNGDAIISIIERAYEVEENKYNDYREQFKNFLPSVSDKLEAIQIENTPYSFESLIRVSYEIIDDYNDLQEYIDDNKRGTSISKMNHFETKIQDEYEVFLSIYDNKNYSELSQCERLEVADMLYSLHGKIISTQIDYVIQSQNETKPGSDERIKLREKLENLITKTNDIANKHVLVTTILMETKMSETRKGK